MNTEQSPMPPIAIVFEFVRPVIDQEMDKDGTTPIHNKRLDKWWIKPKSSTDYGENKSNWILVVLKDQAELLKAQEAARMILED